MGSYEEGKVSLAKKVPFQVLSKINENAYKIELPGEYGVGVTFNVSDLSTFDVCHDKVISRSNYLQEGGDDE